MAKTFKISKRAAWGSLTVLTLLWFVNAADRALLSITLTPIKHAFSLTDAQAGLLYSLLTAGIGIFAIPAAVFGDRWSRRKVVSLMASVWSLCTLATGLGVQFWQLLLSWFGVGSGEGGFGHVGGAWLSVVFPKESRARVMAIYFSCGQMGTVAGLIVGGMLFHYTKNWRTPYYVFAIPGLILGIIVLFLPDYKSVKKEGESMICKAYFKDFYQVFKIPSWWLVTLTTSFTFFFVMALNAWIPTMLIRSYGLSTKAAGLSFGGLFLTFLLGPLGGILVDRWHKRYKDARPCSLAIAVFLIVAIGLVAMSTVGSIPLVFWLTLIGIMVFLVAIFQPLVFTIGQDVVDIRVRAIQGGAYNLIVQLTGASLGPFLVGKISDMAGGGAEGLKTGMLCMVPIAALGVVAALLLLRFYSTDAAKVIDMAEAQ